MPSHSSFDGLCIDWPSKKKKRPIFSTFNCNRNSPYIFSMNGLSFAAASSFLSIGELIWYKIEGFSESSSLIHDAHHCLWFGQAPRHWIRAPWFLRAMFRGSVSFIEFQSSACERMVVKFQNSAPGCCQLLMVQTQKSSSTDLISLLFVSCSHS